MQLHRDEVKKVVLDTGFAASNCAPTCRTKGQPAIRSVVLCHRSRLPLAFADQQHTNIATMSASMMRNARSSRATGRTASCNPASTAVRRPFSSCTHAGPCACRTSVRKAGRCAAAGPTTTAPWVKSVTAADWMAPKEHDLNHRREQGSVACMLSRGGLHRCSIAFTAAIHTTSDSKCNVSCCAQQQAPPGPQPLPHCPGRG